MLEISSVGASSISLSSGVDVAVGERRTHWEGIRREEMDVYVGGVREVEAWVGVWLTGSGCAKVSWVLRMGAGFGDSVGAVVGAWAAGVAVGRGGGGSAGG